MSTLTPRAGQPDHRQALEKAREMKIKPVSVVVLDDGGHLKAMQREDGASMFRFDVATGKAWARLRWAPRAARSQRARKTTRTSSSRSRRPHIGKFLPQIGGVLIRDASGEISGPRARAAAPARRMKPSAPTASSRPGSVAVDATKPLGRHAGLHGPACDTPSWDSIASVSRRSAYATGAARPCRQRRSRSRAPARALVPGAVAEVGRALNAVPRIGRFAASCMMSVRARASELLAKPSRPTSMPTCASLAEPSAPNRRLRRHANVRPLEQPLDEALRARNLADAPGACHNYSRTSPTKCCCTPGAARRYASLSSRASRSTSSRIPLSLTCSYVFQSLSISRFNLAHGPR